MKRKIISMVLILSLAFNTVGQTAIAYNKTNSNTGLIKLDDKGIEKCVKDVALEWAETVKPDVDFTLGEFKEINVVDSNEPEYTVSYFSNALPYGYAVVVFQNNEAIVKEANINPGQEGIYTDLVDTVIDVTDTSRKKLDIDKQIVELAPMQYGVAAKRKSDKRKKFYDNYGSEILSSYLLDEATKYSSHRSIFIKKSNWINSKYKVDNSSKIILNKYKNNSMLFSERDIEKLTKRYCCVVQALLQISYMERLSDWSGSSIKSTYNILWKWCKVEDSKTENGVEYGGATITNANKAFVKLAISKGYLRTVPQKLQKTPSVAWIKDKLKKNYPVLMRYGINVNGKVKGHEISVLGYMKAKKVSSGNTYNYLMVYNSWDNTVNYLNYSTVDFDSCHATFFRLQK